jgi:hypothetical protein
MKIFERKVYRRILGPVYNNEKENCRILTNTEICAIVKKPTITEPFRLRWFGHVERMGENRIPICIIYELESSFGGLVVSMRASGTQVRGFAPDRSRQIFPAGKLHSMPSYGGEVK